MSTFVGVDIGGTFTKVGTVEKVVSFATPHDKTTLCNKIVEAVSGLNTVDLCGVGIGCPGLVKGGVVRFMPNLQIGDFGGEEIQKMLNVRTVVINDANAAALGECLAAGFSDAVMLTLGTGVGGGIVLGGKIYDGMGGAGELGHMIVKADGRKCGCGMRGCLEAYASATALEKKVKRAVARDKNSVMAKMDCDYAIRPFEAAKRGDQSAKKIVDEYVKILGMGILNICNIFRPQAVIIGGGIARQGENLLSKLRDYCRKFDYGYKYAPAPQIIQSKLKFAGVYGAAKTVEYTVKGEYL